jgi:hypothetical protein
LVDTEGSVGRLACYPTDSAWETGTELSTTSYGLCSCLRPSQDTLPDDLSFPSACFELHLPLTGSLSSLLCLNSPFLGLLHLPLTLELHHRTNSGDSQTTDQGDTRNCSHITLLWS